MKRTFVDFFAGIGLAEMGLQQAGWKCVFANDNDPKKKEMYRHNFKRVQYRRCDVLELSASEIPDAALWWGSFPCTDVSLAGYRAGLAGPQSGALLGMLLLLKEKDGQRPPLVLLENVTGFISSHGGSDFEETIRQLNGCGYSCDAFILDAIHFVPQSRPRLFIVGMFDYPITRNVKTALHGRSSQLTSPQLRKFIEKHRDLTWNMFDIPSPPATKRKLSHIVERLVGDSPYWWSSDRVQYLLDQMSPRHRELADAIRHKQKTMFATAYRRMRKGESMAELRADGISGCLRTPKGGSSRQILVQAGRGKLEARFMTPREYARLMGATGYKIEVSDNQAYFGFGDAVCVPAVSWIAHNVLNPLIQTEEQVARAATVQT